MKKLSLIIVLQFACTCIYAQFITFSEAVELYSTWIETKGQNHEPISSQLKMIDQNWTSVKPMIATHSKYFLWEAPAANKQNQQFAAYLEEKENKIRYSLTYVFSSRAQFDLLEKAIRADDRKAVRFINDLKSETEVSSRNSARSVLLREFPAGDGKFSYTLEIFSEYVNK